MIYVLCSCYRWGFRQVEKSSLSGMKFLHPHFIRGDKRRCLLLRSTVNKPLKPLSQPAALPQTGVVDVPPSLNPSTIPLHAFPSNSFVGNTVYRAPSAPLSYHLQLARQALYPVSGLIVRESVFPSSNSVPLASAIPFTSSWTPSSLLTSTIPHQIRVTSSPVFNARSLQVMQNENNKKHSNRTQGAAYNHTLPSPGLPAAVSQGIGFGINDSRRFTGSLNEAGGGVISLAVVVVASHIIKCDPSMSPERALELAKIYLAGSNLSGSFSVSK